MPKNKKTGQRRRKIKKNVPNGIAHIHSTSNNTIVTFTDEQGNVVSWASSGSIGYKGSRKSTPYAASLASEAAAKKALEAGMKSLVISTNGVGPGKDTAIRALANFNFNVTVIRDVTAVPHNGTRPPKKPR